MSDWDTGEVIFKWHDYVIALYLDDSIQILFSQVGKSVSLRLHVELEAIQKKSSQLEWENQELRERLQSLEVAKQVLQTEMDRSREVHSPNLCCSSVITLLNSNRI